MEDQYFGIKELYEVVLRAKTPMQFGSRYVEEEEPVLYFENIKLAQLSERNNPVMARGGWENMPHVIWDSRSEVQFQMIQGVLSSAGMGILLSANVTVPTEEDKIYVHRREGPREIGEDRRFYLDEWPVESNIRKSFIFEYSRDSVQKKIYGKRDQSIVDPFDDTAKKPCIILYDDKECHNLADTSKEYIVDYYYEYKDDALIYTIYKERFNGLFSLEGKFYSKDENEGYNYTNIIYMPKVRIVSDINLRLGERADPTVSTFNIIGLPDNSNMSKRNMIVEITRLGVDLD